MTLPDVDQPEPLTRAEHELIRDIGMLADRFRQILGHDITAGEDFDEIIRIIHVLQARVMAQAAARCYPHKYRLLGGVIK